MSIHRRRFLSSIAAAALASVSLPRPWARPAAAQPAATPAPRLRLEQFVTNRDRVAALKRGVAVMKSRLPSDPTSWFFQAAVHAVTPEAVSAARERDPQVASVDAGKFWNQCPHGAGQDSADFLLWHRGYVYYFERILRAAAEDPTLSLPYWNYTEPGQRSFPRLFGDPDADPGTLAPRNPLYEHRREQAFTLGLYELSEGVVTTSRLVQETDFFGIGEATGLAGGLWSPDGRTRGRLESQPHDLIHFAIGGAIGTGETDEGDATVGLMSSVPTAAFDPIFWVHHANIDRLWAVWDCITSPPRRWGAVPPREWLEAKPWFFHDADRSVQGHTRLHYLNRRNFAFSYDTDAPACSALSSTDPFGATARAPGTPPAAAPRARAFAARAEAGRIAKAVRVSPDQPQTLQVPLRPGPVVGNMNARSAVVAATPDVPRRLVLELRGIRVEGITTVGFDVYANAKPGARLERASPSYVGTVSLFGATHPRAHHVSADDRSQRFDITHLARLPDFDPKAVSVTIVPFDLLTPKAGRPRLRRPVGLTYNEARVIVLEGSSAPSM